MKITNKDGYEVVISEEAMDNYELLEALSEVDDGNTPKLTKALTLLLGKEQKNKFIANYRNEKGVIPATVMYNIIEDLFDGIKEENSGKNS